MPDVWERVPGQERAVELLRRAGAQPSHAYLFVGPPGSGVGDAARCFAAVLLCGAGGCGECSACARVLAGRHPDVVEVEPVGTELRVEQAREIIEVAFRSPVETPRKVIVIHEAERMNEATANRLLKTFEEPPERTIFVLLTSAPDELLPTVRSRCQVVIFSALPAAAARERRRAGPLAGLVAAFESALSRLDGTGAAVALIAARLLDAVEEASAAVKEANTEERERLEAELESAGYPDRDARRALKPVVERHERVERRARTDALAEGLAVLEAVYRDALVGPSDLSPEAALAALDALAATRRALQEGIVLNWGLLLEDLLLHLPAVPTPAGTLAPRSPG